MASTEQKGVPVSSTGNSLQTAHWYTLAGLLSPIGDGVGKVLETGLKPVGHVVGQVGNPAGEAMGKVKITAKNAHGYEEKDSIKSEKDMPGGESVGGKTQSGDNPLGL